MHVNYRVNCIACFLMPMQLVINQPYYKQIVQVAFWIKYFTRVSLRPLDTCPINNKVFLSHLAYVIELVTLNLFFSVAVVYFKKKHLQMNLLRCDSQIQNDLVHCVVS